MKKHLLTVPMMLVLTLVSGCYSTQEPRCASGLCSAEADVVKVETESTQPVYVDAEPTLVREDIAVSTVRTTTCTAPVDLKSGKAACSTSVKTATAPAPAPVQIKEEPAPVVQPLVVKKTVESKDVPEEVLVEPMVVKQAPTPCQKKKPTCLCAQSATITYAPCPCEDKPDCGCKKPEKAPCECQKVEEPVACPAVVEEPAPVAEPSEQEKLQKEMEDLQAQKDALVAERAELEAKLRNMKTTTKTTVEVRDWVAAEGVTLRTLLTEWGDIAGWRVVWNMDRDYTLEASATFRGRFVDVASALIRSFARATPAPKAVFYQGNKVLVVSTREDENAD